MRLALVLLLAGCATSETVQRAHLPERRDDFERRSVEVRTAQDLQLTLDDARLNGGQLEGSGQRVPVDALRQLSWRSHGRGAADGLLIGLALGVAVAVPLGISYQNDCNARNGLVCGLALPAYLVAFGGGGLLAGTLIGAVAGHRYELVIE